MTACPRLLLEAATADPPDRFMQSVLADWLADQGDQAGEAFWRWAAANEMCPCYDLDEHFWLWLLPSPVWPEPVWRFVPASLPGDTCRRAWERAEQGWRLAWAEGWRP